MITMEEIKQISGRLSLENGIANDNLAEDISSIVYRIDVFECGSTHRIDRHIDIEYIFGDYFEVREGTSLFGFICALCDLPLLQEEQELVLWQNDSSRNS